MRIARSGTDRRQRVAARARRRARVAMVGALVVAVLGLATACRQTSVRTGAPAVVDPGDPAAGRQLIVDTGCASCHHVPGVRLADAWVGPPLDSWSRRSYIAGTLPNSATNLRAWLEDPQAIRPGTAMPDLDLDDRQLEDLVAYLFTLD